MEKKALELEIQETEKEKIGNKWCVEGKKVWHIAGPAILNAVSLFSLEFVTAAFAGRLGDLELAAVSEVHNVIAGFVYGVMVCYYIFSPFIVFFGSASQDLKFMSSKLIFSRTLFLSGFKFLIFLVHSN